MGMGYYKLINRLPVLCSDMVEFAEWYETADRRVQWTQVGPLRISTVFLGIDHNFYGNDPILFETMIFDGGEDSYQTRCSTWDEAEYMHDNAVFIATVLVAAGNAMVAKVGEIIEEQRK